MLPLSRETSDREAGNAQSPSARPGLDRRRCPVTNTACPLATGPPGKSSHLTSFEPWAIAITSSSRSRSRADLIGQAVLANRVEALRQFMPALVDSIAAGFGVGLAIGRRRGDDCLERRKQIHISLACPRHVLTAQPAGQARRVGGSSPAGWRDLPLAHRVPHFGRDRSFRRPRRYRDNLPPEPQRLTDVTAGMNS